MSMAMIVMLAVCGCSVAAAMGGMLLLARRAPVTGRDVDA